MNRRTFLSTTGAAASAAALGTSVPAAAAPRRPPADSAPLRAWFEATYRSLQAMTTDFGLTADKIDVSGTGTPVPSSQTSPTNIGCGLWSTVAAAGLGVISPSVMRRRLAHTLAAVERLERAHGFWFNWYDAQDGSLLTTWPETGDPVRPFLSSVDKAWLVTGLMIAADADPGLRPRVSRLLSDADWSYYYTPYDPADPVAGPGQLRGGYWPDKPGKGEPTGHHYGEGGYREYGVDALGMQEEGYNSLGVVTPTPRSSPCPTPVTKPSPTSPPSTVTSARTTTATASATP